MRPNVAFGASDAPNVAFGAFNATNATLGRQRVKSQRVAPCGSAVATPNAVCGVKR
jgi:hypothetical protein